MTLDCDAISQVKFNDFNHIIIAQWEEPVTIKRCLSSKALRCRENISCTYWIRLATNPRRLDILIGGEVVENGCENVNSSVRLL